MVSASMSTPTTLPRIGSHEEQSRCARPDGLVHARPLRSVPVARDSREGAPVEREVRADLCRIRARRVANDVFDRARRPARASRAVCAPSVPPPPSASNSGGRVEAFDAVREGARLAPAWALAWKLSPRLADVCSMLLVGLADKDIAARLSLSPTSVSTYARQIYRKAGVHTRGELTAAAALAMAS